MNAIAGLGLSAVIRLLHPEFGVLLAEGCGARMLHDDLAAQRRQHFLVESLGFGVTVGAD